jgi:hypothetical protein
MVQCKGTTAKLILRFFYDKSINKSDKSLFVYIMGRAFYDKNSTKYFPYYLTRM